MTGTNLVQAILYTAILVISKCYSSPQARVECIGRHALCTFSSCTQNGLCDCWVVNSTFSVSTSEILNETIRIETQKVCTQDKPCNINTAPICNAIINNSYYINNTLSWAVSAFSWEAYCTRADPVNCPTGLWAACMTASCIERDNDPNLALCSCPVKLSPWIDFQYPNKQSNCKYPNGVITSTVPANFSMEVLPGASYALEACAALPTLV